MTDPLAIRIERVKGALITYGRNSFVVGEANRFNEALIENKLPAVELVVLLTTVVAIWGSAIREPTTEILRSHIDIALVNEQVEAQRISSEASENLAITNNRLSSTNNKLAGAAVFFAVVQVVVAILQWHSSK